MKTTSRFSALALCVFIAQLLNCAGHAGGNDSNDDDSYGVPDEPDVE